MFAIATFLGKNKKTKNKVAIDTEKADYIDKKDGTEVGSSSYFSFYENPPDLSDQFERLNGIQFRYRHKLAIIVFIWLFIGTFCYRSLLDVDFSLAYYMSINVGFSIGFGDLNADSDSSKIFSIFYIFVGTSFVAACMGMTKNN